jgi:protein-S-isoprenylcysteine O-methyltransferase Ste14
VSVAQQKSWARIARRIRVPVGFVFAAVYLWLAHPTWLSLIAGVAVAALGLALRAAAAGHVKKNTELTTTGPYAYTRNPLYLGSLLIAVGFAIASRSLWIALILIVLLAGIYWPVIRSEEEYLRAHFPEFEEYARRVPRLIPRLRAATAAAGAFSPALYRKHREYNALLGSLAMTVALICKIILQS